jgi:hypothetical protein
MSARKVPSLRHHKARGLAVVTLGGKDFYCGKLGSPESRREYDRVVGEWRAAGRPQVAGGAQTLTMAESLVRYMEYARAATSPLRERLRESRSRCGRRKRTTATRQPSSPRHGRPWTRPYFVTRSRTCRRPSGRCLSRMWFTQFWPEVEPVPLG